MKTPFNPTTHNPHKVLKQDEHCDLTENSASLSPFTFRLASFLSLSSIHFLSLSSPFTFSHSLFQGSRVHLTAQDFLPSSLFPSQLFPLLFFLSSLLVKGELEEGTIHFRIKATSDSLTSESAILKENMSETLVTIEREREKVGVRERGLE